MASSTAELERLAEEAAECLESGDAARALDVARRGSRGAGRGAPPELRAELAVLEGMALADLGDAPAAVERLDVALALQPGDLDAQRERGLALLEACRFDEARAQLQALVRADPGDAWAQHGLGLLAERRGEAVEAERRFSRARRLAPAEFPRSPVLAPQAFDAAVEDALEALPEPVRRWLANVAIAVEDLPPDDDLLGADPPHPPSILGIFRGAPLGDKASMDPWSHFPSSIVLYQKNLERFTRSRGELVEEIRVTLLHEVGHFLGLDEGELEALGLD